MEVDYSPVEQFSLIEERVFYGVSVGRLERQTPSIYRLSLTKNLRAEIRQVVVQTSTP